MKRAVGHLVVLAFELLTGFVIVLYAHSHQDLPFFFLGFFAVLAAAAQAESFGYPFCPGFFFGDLSSCG
jgi:hypothetical protein